MNKLLLIGGFGFIGRNIIEILQDKYDITVVNRSIDKDFISDKKIKYFKYDFNKDIHLEKIISDVEPDYIINLVSVVTASRNLDLFDEMIKSNINVLMHIYKSCRNLRDLKLFINFGSSEEYGNANSPFNENSREYPNSPYALAKQLTTNTAIMLNRNYGFPIMVVRPGNVFGKYQSGDKFIPYIIRKLLNNEVIETTMCEQKRDFIYVNDLVFIIDEILKEHENFKGEILNVSYGQSIILKDIIEYCREAIGSTSLVEYGKMAYRANEIMDFTCDITKLREKLGFEFKFNLLEALKHYINLIRG